MSTMAASSEANQPAKFPSPFIEHLREEAIRVRARSNYDDTPTSGEGTSPRRDFVLLAIVLK